MALENFEEKRMSFRGWERPVMVAVSSGPPVLVLHEIYGMTATVADFGEMIRAAGFRVFMPVLYGSTKTKSGGMAKALRAIEFACVAHQFKMFAANESGPWSDWLRDLVDQVCAESGYEGAGVIGLCLTGNFALSAAKNVRVKAPVMGEPSLPIWGDGLHLRPDELEAVKARVKDGLEVRAYRYSTDTICRARLFERLRSELGDGFKGQMIPVQEQLHSVFTEHLRDNAGRLRHSKVQEVIEFLKVALSA